MKKLLSFVLLLSIAAMPACKKNESPDTTNVNNINELNVPDGFTWTSSHDVSITANITDARFGSANHTISIYDGDPYNGGSLLTKGSASTSASFQNTLHLSKQISKVYVVKTSPDGSRIINTLDVTTPNATISFGDIDPSVMKPNMSGLAKVTSIDCNTGCTNTISNTTNNVNVNSGDVVCITGSNITVNFSGVNGTVRVCGSNVTLQNLSLNGSASLLVASSGSVNLSNFNMNSSSSTLQNEGTINLSGSSSVAGTVYNSGTITVGSDYNINSSTTSFTNDGVINISGSFNSGATQGVPVVNNGQITVSNNFQPNSSGTFVNNCSIIVGSNFNQSAPVQNYGLIKVNGTSTLNSGNELSLYNTSMFVTNNFITNIPVKGYGSTSFVKITGSVTINGNGVFDANLQVCSNTTISPSKFTNGATDGCSLYIPQNGCNTVGNGTPTVTDTDNDGVPDNTDDYPNDPTKAYNNYYPSSTTMSTVAFEDQWPSKGDYDLNDLVMAFRYKIVTNAANNVVEVNGTYKLRATGGSYGNAFAVQFPVDRSNVSGLSFGTLENSQTKAVVVLFPNMRDQMANWNTETGATTSPAVDYNITFSVANGANISNFGLNAYNPFIWNANDIRGREIHLVGQLPTDLASTNLFGTGDDNSSIANNRYYVTTTGLPYAIEVPTTTFNYPVERADITQAYLHLADWVISGGTAYTDWYSNTASGYRNAANIY